MGMSRMFSNTAEFGKMLETGEALQVSKVIHKAFIEVNEKGTEAAAATGKLNVFLVIFLFVFRYCFWFLFCIVFLSFSIE